MCKYTVSTLNTKIMYEITINARFAILKKIYIFYGCYTFEFKRTFFLNIMHVFNFFIFNKNIR